MKKRIATIFIVEGVLASVGGTFLLFGGIVSLGVLFNVIGAISGIYGLWLVYPDNVPKHSIWSILFQENFGLPLDESHIDPDYKAAIKQLDKEFPGMLGEREAKE